MKTVTWVNGTLVQLASILVFLYWSQLYLLRLLFCWYASSSSITWCTNSFSCFGRYRPSKQGNARVDKEGSLLMTVSWSELITDLTDASCKIKANWAKFKFSNVSLQLVRVKEAKPETRGETIATLVSQVDQKAAQLWCIFFLPN